MSQTVAENWLTLSPKQASSRIYGIVGDRLRASK